MALPFHQESWIWYTCAVLMIGARLTSRSLKFRSFKSLESDDYIMGLLVTAACTAMTVCANKYFKSQSNLLPPGFDLTTLSESDMQQRRYGSKMVVVVEQTTIAVIWSCKACLLIMYARLTHMALHKENIAIRLLAAYVALGFIVMEVLYFAAWCRPIAQYWAVPTTNHQCNALVNHRIVKAVFNLSSDIIMLTIGLQMLIRSMLPMKKKLILVGIFSVGVFVIIASIMNSYFSFKDPYKQTWVYWYVREASTAILVANLPFTWQILREIFDLGTFDESSPPPWTFHSPRTAQGRRTAQIHGHPTQSPTMTRTHPTPGVSKESRGTPPMTLIDSLSPRSPRQSQGNRHSHTRTTQSSETEKEPADASVQAHDFAIDLEQGLAGDASSSSPLRAAPKITEDGTGGFYINNRQISPPVRAYMAGQSHPSRAPSLGSADGRPLSPTPSFTSLESADMRQQRKEITGTAGTGRSAHDRRARVKMSG